MPPSEFTMIDFHTHILPAIDDGSRDESESCELLSRLERQGVDTVLLTPHYYGRDYSVPKFLERREKAFSALKSAYSGNIRLIKACEYNIATDVNSDFMSLVPLAIGNTSYILTELSFENEWGDRLFKRINSLQLCGLTPVIAHAELYPAVRKNPSLVARLIDGGCYIQINCGSVISSDPLVAALINGMQVHCLGSDTHNTTKRPPEYGRAIEMLSTSFGSQTAEGLNDNMNLILQGKPLSVRRGAAVKRTLFGKYK